LRYFRLIVIKLKNKWYNQDDQKRPLGMQTRKLKGRIIGIPEREVLKKTKNIAVIITMHNTKMTV
jgi:hypothetical protein